MRPQSSEGTASTTKLKDAKQQPKLDYRSMVSVDDKPELFISVDSKSILFQCFCRFFLIVFVDQIFFVEFFLLKLTICYLLVWGLILENMCIVIRNFSQFMFKK